jgi:lipopolysaccharide export system protein LptA
MLDVAFLPEGGVRSITQTGNVAYVDGTQKAWAQRGEYTTADQMLVLTGSPRVVDGGMTTTAQTIRMNRATGDAFAEGNVKSTYSDLKAQPDGAMLASSDPIHVTSRSMTAHRSSAIAVYTGDARLWQDATSWRLPRCNLIATIGLFLRMGRSAWGRGSDPSQLLLNRFRPCWCKWTRAAR